MGEREGESRKTAQCFDDTGFLLSKEGGHGLSALGTDHANLQRGQSAGPHEDNSAEFPLQTGKLSGPEGERLSLKKKKKQKSKEKKESK